MNWQKGTLSEAGHHLQTVARKDDPEEAKRYFHEKKETIWKLNEKKESEMKP